MLYPAITVTTLNGSEPLHSASNSLGHTVLDFWRWSYSNLVNNASRGVLAEYLVASALGVTNRGRVEWDAYDLVTADGIKVEVKSAAYLQSWSQAKLSTIRFAIPKTLSWNSETNTYDVQKKRKADVYIFCLLHHQEKATLDPLDVTQWTFYVVGSAILESACPQSASLTLNALLKLGVTAVCYEQIASQVGSRSKNSLPN